MSLVQPSQVYEVQSTERMSIGVSHNTLAGPSLSILSLVVGALLHPRVRNLSIVRSSQCLHCFCLASCSAAQSRLSFAFDRPGDKKVAGVEDHDAH